MKKSVFLSFFLACILMSNAFGDGTVGNLTAHGCGNGGDEYFNIGNSQCVECDKNSDYNDAPMGTRVYTFYNKNGYPIAYNECVRIEKAMGTHDDKWTAAKGVTNCSNNTCNSGNEMSIPNTANYTICVPSGFLTQTLGKGVFVNGGNGICYIDKSKPSESSKCPTQKGYAKPGDKATGPCSGSNGVSVNLRSTANMVSGAKCDLECQSDGWVLRLRADSCASGYEPSQDLKECVPTVEGNRCRFTGGEWNTGIQQCTCPPSKKLTNDGTDKCKCSQSGYEWDWEKEACVNGAGRTYSQQAVVNTNIYNANQRKKACTDSGGTMPGSTCVCDAAKFMVLSSGVCTCMPGYEWATPGTESLGCKITDTETVRRACDAATNADWNATTQKCVCKDADYVLDVDAQTCKPIAALAECQPLMSNNKARWDATSKTCVCSQAGYAIVNGDCVETEAAATARKDKEMKSAKNKIEDVHSKLKRVQDGFKVSAWKNEEGKFNTARLASDSIAGVVLGTAGGLVTSKVVKKNQVENGFEDIQCTIGGQTVAQWGDDFSVGTQF